MMADLKTYSHQREEAEMMQGLMEDQEWTIRGPTLVTVE
jgi:hypothetical protein